MDARIKSVAAGTPADGTKIVPGDTLISVNGHPIEDVLDYKFYSYEPKLHIVAEDIYGKRKKVRIRKSEGEDVGLEFETYLMDEPKSCANRCMFCFVDQLPEGMRSTLYFKDDDARLSFLQGNYITLTNLSEHDARRMIDMRVSPINVSVHTTDPALRCRMLGNKNGGTSLEYLKRFAEAGITMNCQIVCCPGINDGEQLAKTMVDLAEMYPSVSSVSVVPVGLTKHREGLYKLKPFEKNSAAETIDQVEKYADGCMERFGSRIFFCADELYIKAQRPLPEDEYYEGYPQLENGVGLIRLLFTEFESLLEEKPENKGVSFTAVTGMSAQPFIAELIEKAKAVYPELSGNVYGIVNDFFGDSVNVAGLVTGGDIIRQLAGKDICGRLLIPRNMLRHGETVFLDNVSLLDIEEAFNTKIRIVEQDGADLLSAMLGN